MTFVLGDTKSDPQRGPIAGEKGSISENASQDMAAERSRILN